MAGRLIAAPLTIALIAIVTSVPTSALHAREFIRGDADADGAISIADALTILNHLFLGGSVACEDAADLDNDGSLRINDPMVLIRFLFQNGPRYPSPFPSCGFDIDEGPADDLSCDESTCRYTPFDLDIPWGNIVFVIDRSLFMQGNGELGLIKQEVLRAIGRFRVGRRFAVITHDGALESFPEVGLIEVNRPNLAGISTQTRAINWVSGIVGGDAASCPFEALVAAVERRGVTSVVYMGTARGICPDSELREEEYLADALERVVELSSDRVQIHVVEFFAAADRNFLRELAGRTEGHYLNYDEITNR